MYLFIFVLSWFGISYCDDHFFMVKKYMNSSEDYYCLTNSSYALSWIQEDTNRTLQQASSFVPDLQNSFDWNNVSKPWSLENSLNGHVNEMILDRRWEGMPVIRTRKLMEDFTLHFIPILSKRNDSFVIPLSFRIRGEAHILLCDGKSESQSHCYWFLLQVFDQKRTLLRKCRVRNINLLNGESSKPPCSRNLREKQHPSGLSPYLTDREWTHFKLEKSKNRLKFSQINENEEKVIIEYDDNSDIINVNNIIIHSEVPGLWKVHALDYMYTNQVTDRIRFGPAISGVKSSVCISMFVSMCRSCKIKLTLSKEDNQYQILQENIYNYQKPGWTEIKIIKDNIKTRQVILLISTLNDKNEEGFWAIDEIRQCQKTEFRKISLNEEAKCQLLSGSGNVIWTHKTTSHVENQCPEDAVSGGCVPCSWICPGSCDRLKICEKYATDVRCSCSPGYSSDDGDECGEKCPRGRFGHGCRKRCENCYSNSCSSVDGRCRSSTKSVTIFRKNFFQTLTIGHSSPPRVRNITYTEATIEVANFKKSKTDDRPKTYQLQYKGASGNPVWIPHGAPFEISEPQTIRIKNLEPGTKYFVRYAITTSIGRVYTPNANFTTKCDEITHKNIELKRSNTSVDMFLIETSTICKFNSYQISISGVEGPAYYTNTNIYFEKLKPFSNYTVVFTGNSRPLEIPFRTTEGVPEAVTDLTVANVSSSSIELRWKRPMAMYGEFQHYIVECQDVRSRICDHKSVDMSQFQFSRNGQETYMILSDLIPYSTYKLAVLAKNTVFEGKRQFVWASTGPSDTIQEEEMPEIKPINPATIREVHVEFAPISCTQLRGPLLIKLNATCTNEWCKNSSTKDLNYTEDASARLKHLMPFSDYDVEAKYCRNHTLCSNVVKSKSFRSKPTVPGPVQELSVYSKNESSISLRWKPPYPPTGDLALYKVTYNDSKYSKDKNFTSFCEMWPQYHCAVLSSLKRDHSYDITVQAKNKNPDGFGLTMYINSMTKTEKPDPPYDLVFQWTLQNDLELEWKHPNVTNGDLQYFHIQIAQKNETININKNMTIVRYKPTYHFKVETKDLLSSTECTIRIKAFNGYLSDELFGRDTSPPTTPSLDAAPKISSSNNTVAIDIRADKLKESSKDQNNYKLFLLVSEENSDKSGPELEKLQEDLQVDLSGFRIVYECDPRESNISHFTIGDGSKIDECKSEPNPPLASGTTYNITIILINSFNNKSRYKLYSFSHKSMDETDLRLLALLSLLILPVTIFIVYRRVSIKRNWPQDNHTHESVIPLTEHYEDEHKNGNTYITNSNPIQITKFQNYVKSSIQNDELRNQHKLVLLRNIAATVYEVDNSFFFDYIDMSFVNDNIKKAYIIASVPQKGSIDAFWRTIWDENVEHIVLLDNIYDRKKNANYWVEKHENVQCGDISVQLYFSEFFADYEYRKFIINKKGAIKYVDQLRYVSWFGNDEVPHFLNYVPFFEKMSKIPLSSTSPVLVHCRSGIGGTGFALLCDMCLRTAQKDKVIDVAGKLQKLNDCVSMLIPKTPEQYVVMHLIIVETLFCLNASTSETQNSTDETENQKSRLKKMQWLDEAMEAMKQKETRVKGSGRSTLRIYQQSGGRILHKNKLIVDGFRNPGKFIVTQNPTSHTLVDFWNLIEERNVSVIISMNAVHPKCVNFWPSEDQMVLTLSKCASVKYQNGKSLGCYDWVTVQLTGTSTCRNIDIVSMKQWPPETDSPPDVYNFIKFCSESNEISKRSHPVVVTCFDGIKASGLYVTMLYNMEKMKEENVCDVCTSTRIVRRHCQQFVKNEEQIEFLYEAALMYKKEFHLYNI